MASCVVKNGYWGQRFDVFEDVFWVEEFGVDVCGSVEVEADDEDLSRDVSAPMILVRGIT